MRTATRRRKWDFLETLNQYEQVAVNEAQRRNLARNAKFSTLSRTGKRPQQVLCLRPFEVNSLIADSTVEIRRQMWPVRAFCPYGKVGSVRHVAEDCKQVPGAALFVYGGSTDYRLAQPAWIEYKAHNAPFASYRFKVVIQKISRDVEPFWWHLWLHWVRPDAVVGDPAQG